MSLDQVTKRVLKQYYLFLGPGFFILLGLGLILKVQPFSLLFALLAYLTPCALEAPGLREKSMSKRYKISFMRILYFVRESSQKLLPLKDEALLTVGRHIPSLLLVNTMYVLNPTGNLATWFVGLLLFEVSYFLFKKSVKPL